jgi:pantetheine-phosphate adenylyltransferase
MQYVLYPGTFDPVTLGHLDIINRAANIFDHVTIAVAASPTKKPMFSLRERVSLLQESTQNRSNVSVEGFSGLLIEFAKEKQINILIRGLRTTMDFEYEFGLTSMYRKLYPSMESIFLTPGEEYAFLSSTIVREVAIHGGDITQFVPPSVAEKIHKKLNF